MSAPLAYLLTWTTYGTWLHGDDRGSAGRTEANLHGHPYLTSNPSRVRFEQHELTHRPVVLDHTRRDAVRQAIVEHAAHRRWALHTINVRTNHVHIVLSCNAQPEKALQECKAWATRRLREQQLAGTEQNILTRHGSTRYLYHQQALEGAIRYVV